jgi:hypothetical protein
MEASSGSLEEYEQQLADVEELLKSTPDDATLLSLKNDLVELVTLTRGESSVANNNNNNNNDNNYEDVNDEETTETREAGDSSLGLDSFAAAEEETLLIADETTAAAPKKKKTREIKEFEIPPRFLPLDTDTEAEANKKKRAIKSLKRQHRATVKEAESEKKQKTWQSFQKKKKLNKDGSIFSTHDDADAKIGVVTSRKKTEFSDRTRHK